jgi:predicted Zn-dependent peptidase
MKRRTTLSTLLLVVAVATTPALAQNLADRVTEATLANGLRVLLVEQTDAPVIAFNLTFDVGAVDEPEGLGGIAHMVEHMAFKGTASIGSLDPEAEAAALAKLEVAALALEWLRKNGNADEIAAAEATFAAARDEAQALAQSSPLDELLSVNGGVGLNASTGLDRTSYVLSLPANRLELYARVYADVLLDTTFRYFYPERDVVREERRQRSEDDPQGFLFEAFLAEAFSRHPYRRPTIGSGEEIERYTATEAEAFFDTLYHPNRAVLVLVGNVEPERDLAILERYFGMLEAGPDLRPVPAGEPPQTAERRTTVDYDAEPQIVIGYHKPTYPDRDAYVLDLVDAILSAGRTSRLYQRMVLRDQSALDITTSPSFPGVRYDNLFLFYGLPRAPFGTDDLEQAFYQEIERLAEDGVGEEELQKVRNQVRASVIRGLASGSGLAANLAFNELFGGGWERFEGDLEIYDSITAEEIQAVVRRTFREENRTVAVLAREE